MSKWFVGLLALWSVLVGTGAARAQMVTAADPGAVVAALQSAGYQAELTKDKAGDPMIRSTSSGTRFTVFFYGCEGNVRCTSVQYFAGYTDAKVKALADINKWNADRRFGRAYIDGDGDPCIEMDINLDHGGMSRGLFVGNLEFWVSIMAGFVKLIYAR